MAKKSTHKERNRHFTRNIDPTVGGASYPEHGSSPKPDRAVMLIPVNKVVPSRYQTRNVDEDSIGMHELRQSIRGAGMIIHPPTARPHPTENGIYELITGERRFRAWVLEENTHINLDVFFKLTEQQAATMNFVENVHRENLTTVERTAAIDNIQKQFEMDVDEIAQLMGLSKPRIYQLLGAGNIPEELCILLTANGLFTARHIQAVSKLKGRPQDQENLCGEIVAEGLSGELALERVKEMTDPGRPKTPYSETLRCLTKANQRWPKKTTDKKAEWITADATLALERIMIGWKKIDSPERIAEQLISQVIGLCGPDLAINKFRAVIAQMTKDR